MGCQVVPTGITEVKSAFALVPLGALMHSGSIFSSTAVQKNHKMEVCWIGVMLLNAPPDRMEPGL